jgi:hydrogenase maturation protease
MSSAVIKTMIETRTGDQILLIGYGNTLRRDDGAGVKLAERLAVAMWAIGRPVKLLTVPQLVPELAADIADDSVAAVIFVDAAAGLFPPEITIHRIDRANPTPSLGHHLDPTALLTYAELLYGRSAPAWLVTVPGIDFGHGECLSPSVQRLLCNAPQVAEQLCGEIEACLSCTNLQLRNN